MELKIVRNGEWRPAVLGGGVPSLHEDILNGRDAEISWEDVYTDPARVVGGEAGTGVHDEMERSVSMGKW
jgi:proteasome maturation protein